jgi:hypothetical protein
MSVFSKILDFVSGGIGEKIVETIQGQFPARMSEADKKQIEEAVRQAARQHEMQLLTMAQAEEQEFNNRIRDLEGTAKDLNASGFFGRIIIFMRGAQRPLWGYFVLVLDIMVFSGKWDLAGKSAGGLDLVNVFWVINLLVLGFLFGERAMRNVMPIVQAKLGKNQAQG